MWLHIRIIGAEQLFRAIYRQLLDDVHVLDLTVIDKPLEHFLERFCKSMNRKGLKFAGEAVEALQAYHWPGNVRELQNAIERAVVLGSPPTIEASDLPLYVTDKTGARPSTGSLADVERAHIEAVLTQHEWNISRAARTLEVDRGTLYNKIHKYELEEL